MINKNISVDKMGRAEKGERGEVRWEVAFGEEGGVGMFG